MKIKRHKKTIADLSLGAQKAVQNISKRDYRWAKGFDELLNQNEVIAFIKTTDPTYLMRFDGMTYKILNELQDFVGVPQGKRLTERQKIKREVEAARHKLRDALNKLKYIGDMP